MHILITWVKLIPKTNDKFLDYYETVLTNLAQSTDYVLIFEQAQCLYEMLKEIEYWLKRAAAGLNAGEFPTVSGSLRRGDLIDFDQMASSVESEDEQIKNCTRIHSNINYMRTFQVVCEKMVTLLQEFNSPNLVWKLVNILSFILERNTDRAEHLISGLHQLNIAKLLGIGSEQVHEALIDMLK